jgi:hypothetical protein
MIEVVQAIQSAIVTVGKLRNFSKKIEDSEFKMLLAELLGELADAKVQVAQLQGDLAKLIEENQSLTARLTAKSSLKPIFKDGAYTFEGDEGAFCTACFDTKQQRVRLSKLAPPFDDIGKWQCPSCECILN